MHPVGPMASYPPAGCLPCYKASVLPAAGSAASTATGCSSNGSTLSTRASEVGTPRPEEPFYYYLHYAAMQAAANGWDATSKNAKAISIDDDSVSVSMPKKEQKVPRSSAKQFLDGSRRHWILPPPVESRPQEPVEVPAAEPKRSSQAGKVKTQSNAFTRHWMLDPPKDQDQDAASNVTTEAKAEPHSFTSSFFNNICNFMPASRETDRSIKEEDCVGKWCYPKSSYVVSRTADGFLCFEHALPSGGTITGSLRQAGEWLEGEVYAGGTEHVGTIRLRPGDAPRTLLSNFRGAPKISGSTHDGFGALVAGKADWGPDVLATKEEMKVAAFPGPKQLEPKQQKPELAPQRWPLSAGQLEPRRPPTAQPHDGQSLGARVDTSPAVEVPVRNTFIQFDEPKPFTLLRSSPAILTRGPFMTKPPVKVEAHIVGNCRPCAYFWGKEDGCRGGDTCKFCHLCQPGELKRRRREKDRQLRAQQRAARTAPSVASA